MTRPALLAAMRTARGDAAKLAVVLEAVAARIRPLVEREWVGGAVMAALAELGGEGSGRALAGAVACERDKIEARAALVRENETEGK